MTTRLRLPQPRYGSDHRDGWHPDIPSDGLTLNTDHGPVDLVAVERVLIGHPTPVTRADLHYATATLPDGGAGHVEPLAAGLGIDPEGVRRAFERRKAETRTQT